jgi:F420-non-reducing hydrogenase iron-sulfur subunit
MFGARRAAETFEKIEKMMTMVGLEKERVRREMVSAAESSKFAEIVTDMINQVKKLGPSPLKTNGQNTQSDKVEVQVA